MTESSGKAMALESGFLTALRRRVLLYDGAMGTMLFAAGLQDGDPPEPWNWERPEVVRGIYAAYYEAGADVVQTNTFGGTPIKLSENGLEARVHEANLSAARALRSVCPAGRFVAGNIGPTGKFLQPMGEYTRAQFEESFAAQAQGLIEGGVDLISIETMYSLEEALGALAAVRRIGSLPVVVSMTFDRNPRGFFTLMGEPVERCMRTLADHGADVVGSNCSHGSEVFIDLAREIRAATDRPVIVQPNRGRPVLEGDGVVYRQTAGEFAADAAKLLALGIDVIGGCCGTDPGLIARIRPLLQSGRTASGRREEGP